MTYYALITLNQIVLSASPADVSVARELVGLYFEVFIGILGVRKTDGHSLQASVASEDGDRQQDGDAARRKKGMGRGKARNVAAGRAGPFQEVEDSNSKLIIAALTGLHRALPFAGVQGDDR
jgi:ribosome biogenesis protein MAK21